MTTVTVEFNDAATPADKKRVRDIFLSRRVVDVNDITEKGNTMAVRNVPDTEAETIRQEIRRSLPEDVIEHIRLG